MADPTHEHRAENETEETVNVRLEYLRSQIERERISWYELFELQQLADQIDPSDVQLLEWAGVPENA